MPREYSPFTPGVPVPIEFFTGRSAEIEKTVAAVEAATAGRPKTLFLCGERGIGKSSLARLVRHIAESRHGALGLHTFLGGATSLEEMVRRIFDRIVKESVQKRWYKKIADFFGDRIRKVGIFDIGVEFGAGEQDLSRLVNDFVPAMRNLTKRLEGEKSSIFLILDDINGLANDERFANWVKSIVDEIATSRSEPLPLCLLLVGLEERRQSMIQHQPSLARIFDIVEIQPWSEQETKEFFNKAFSKVEISVEEAALDVLSRYAGGLPVLAHEIGDATFNANQDDVVDRKDALQGVVMAADIVGRKHLQPQVFQAIRSKKYRAILRKITEKPSEIEFSSRDIKSKLRAEEQKVYNNFLVRMQKLGVIKKDPEGGPGAYRFTNQLHRLYFWLEAQWAKEARDEG